MDFLKDKAMLRTLIQQGDLLNTLNGGHILVQPLIEINDFVFQIRLKAPSLNADSFDINLNNNELIIYGLLRGGKEFEFSTPLYAQKIILPIGADLDSIEAQYKDDELILRIPLLKSSQTRNMRKIVVKQ